MPDLHPWNAAIRLLEDGLSFMPPLCHRSACHRFGGAQFQDMQAAASSSHGSPALGNQEPRKAKGETTVGFG
jgi:hypothetical protein